MSDPSRRAPGWRVGAGLVGAIVAISFAAIFFRLAQPTHPLVAAAVRLALAAGCLSPLIVRGLRRGTLSSAHLGWALAGGVCYAVHFGAWVWSLELTSVAASVTLVTATPLLLALLSLGTGRDRPTGRLWGALGLACAGIVVIGWADHAGGGGAWVGDALALLGAAAMAAYLLVVRRQGRALDVLAFSGVVCAVGAALLALSCLVAGVPLRVAGPEALGYLALAAALPQLVGHTLLTWSLRHVTPTAAGIATLGEPVGATLLGVVWLGEWVSWEAALGCGLVIAGVALALARRPRQRTGGPDAQVS